PGLQIRSRRAFDELYWPSDQYACEVEYSAIRASTCSGAKGSPMLRIARASDEQSLFPLYTHQLVERFLTFDGVDAQRFSGIFRSLLESGDFFVYEVDGAIVGFCKA